MSLPVLPSPQALSPADLADYGAQVVAWAEQIDDVAAVRDMSNKWAAITEYVRRTSREGIAEAEAALRRLEVRVGALLGPPPGPGRPAVNGSTIPNTDVERHAANDFRTLAEHPEIVEQVIAESSDSEPPSRRKVLQAIRRKTKPAETPEQREAREHDEAINRRVKRLEMFCSSFHEFRRLATNPDRAEVLDRLTPGDREIVLTAERSIQWLA